MQYCGVQSFSVVLNLLVSAGLNLPEFTLFFLIKELKVYWYFTAIIHCTVPLTGLTTWSGW